eukprot:6210340-Pleurochrysis_carterae.AAC.3
MLADCNFSLHSSGLATLVLVNEYAPYERARARASAEYLAAIAYTNSFADLVLCCRPHFCQNILRDPLGGAPPH